MSDQEIRPTTAGLEDGEGRQTETADGTKLALGAATATAASWKLAVQDGDGTKLALGATTATAASWKLAVQDGDGTKLALGATMAMEDDDAAWVCSDCGMGMQLLLV